MELTGIMRENCSAPDVEVPLGMELEDGLYADFAGENHGAATRAQARDRQQARTVIRSATRKMAADPYAFCRGSASIFYADMQELKDAWTDESTSRVWIRGGLHAERFGAYTSGEDRLTFDVNDFDEAYVGSLLLGPAPVRGVLAPAVPAEGTAVGGRLRPRADLSPVLSRPGP